MEESEEDMKKKGRVKKWNEKGEEKEKNGRKETTSLTGRPRYTNP
jgi:hypothetical protein